MQAELLAFYPKVLLAVQGFYVILRHANNVFSLVCRIKSNGQLKCG